MKSDLFSILTSLKGSIYLWIPLLNPQLPRVVILFPRVVFRVLVATRKPTRVRVLQNSSFVNGKTTRPVCVVDVDNERRRRQLPTRALHCYHSGTEALEILFPKEETKKLLFDDRARSSTITSRWRLSLKWIMKRIGLGDDHGRLAQSTPTAFSSSIFRSAYVSLTFISRV